MNVSGGINSRLNAKKKQNKKHSLNMNMNTIIILSFFYMQIMQKNIVLNSSMEAVLEQPTFWNRATIWIMNFLFYYTMTWKKKKQLWDIIGIQNSRRWIPMRGWKVEILLFLTFVAEPHTKVFITFRFQRLDFGSWQGVTATTTFKMSNFKLSGWDSVFLKQVYEWKGRNSEDPQVLKSTD